MKLLTTAVLLVLSVIARANSESHGAPVPVAAPKKVGSVYLVPVFVPNQEEYANGGEGGLGSYREPTPLQKIVLGYTPREQQVSLQQQADLDWQIA